MTKLDEGAVPNAPSMGQIISVVAREYDITPAQLKGRYRSRRIEKARTMAMYLCCDMTNESLATIGYAFDRHHTTVLAVRDKMRARLKFNHVDESIADKLRDRIRTGLGAAEVAKESAALAQLEMPDAMQRQILGCLEAAAQMRVALRSLAAGMNAIADALETEPK